MNIIRTGMALRNPTSGKENSWTLKECTSDVWSNAESANIWCSLRCDQQSATECLIIQAASFTPPHRQVSGTEMIHTWVTHHGPHPNLCREGWTILGATFLGHPSMDFPICGEINSSTYCINTINSRRPHKLLHSPPKKDLECDL